MKVPALFIFDPAVWENTCDPADIGRLETLVPTPFLFRSPQATFQPSAELARIEVLFSTWGMPRCDETFLEALPNLKAIFYAAGSVRPFATEALWRRKIVVSSCNRALSVTVAEFALAQILLSLKLTWRHAAEMRTLRRSLRHKLPGIYNSTVGLISVGAVARHLLLLLRSFHLRIVAYDPFLSEEEARHLGIELLPLEKLFEVSHVVSLHTPALPTTEGMIRGHHLARMRRDATFINTARGAVVNEAEMIEVLRERPDLHALLDVTHPEIPAPDSALYTLPNVMLTPHIAGALDGECRRLGAMAVDEFERYLRDEPLIGEVRPEMLATMA